MAAPTSHQHSLSAPSSSSSQAIVALSSSGGHRNNQQWHLPPEERLDVEFSRDGKPVGENATSFSSACGKIAKMGIWFPITTDYWSNIPESNIEEMMKYMEEKFIIHKSLQKHVFESISRCWRTCKSRLRRSIDARLKTNESIESIRNHGPKYVNPLQWREFVRVYTSTVGNNTWTAKTAKARAIRSKQKEFHTCGRTSFAQKRKIWEKDGPIGAGRFYQLTHTKKDNTMHEHSLQIMNQFHSRLSEREGEEERDVVNSLALEEDVICEVRGLQYSGRVRKGTNETNTASSSIESLVFEEQNKKIEVLYQEIESLRTQCHEIERLKADYTDLKQQMSLLVSIVTS